MPPQTLRFRNKVTGEIVEIPQADLSTPQTAQVQQGGGLAGMLGGLLSPLERYARMVGGGLIQAPILAATGGKTNIPFMSEESLQKFGTPGGGALEAGKRIAGAGAFALPTGAGLLPKVATGALRGGMYGFSQPQATVGSVAATAAGGAALEPALSMLLGGITKPRALLQPRKYFGGKMETAVGQAGRQPSPEGLDLTQQLEKRFGMLGAPNPQLLEGAGPSAMRGPMARIVNREIATQGRSDVPGIGPTYKEVFDFKTGADKLAGWGEKSITPQQALYRNISNAYGDVLKEGVPGYTNLAKTFATVTKAVGSAETLGRYTLSHILPWVILGTILRNVMSGVTGVTGGGQ